MSGGPPPLPVSGQGNGGAGLLSKVKLLSFTASPDHILPFESSTLRWQAQTPGGVTFSLDSFVSAVPAVGMEVVEPAFTSVFMLQARAREAEVTLGTVTVSVDTSQCNQQTHSDAAFDIWVLLLGAFVAGATNHGDTVDIPTSHPVSVTISPGVIAFEVKGTLTLIQQTGGLIVNIDVKGGFGLMVDRTADQLAPTNESNNVNCDVDWYRWVAFISASIATGAIAGGLIGALFSGGGALIGIVIGAIAGGAAAAALLSWIISKVTNAISSSLPGGIKTLVHTMNSKWFTEPTGMAMAAVSIDPDPMSPPDGNITVTYCPSAGGSGGSTVA